MVSDLAGTFEGWVPTEYLDEVSPPARDTPDDWLARRHDGLHLAWPDDGGGGQVLPPLLADGQTVSFHGYTDYGEIALTWRGPGDYTVHGPVPEGASLFCVSGDPDTLGMSIADFVSGGEAREHFEAGEEVTVSCYDWSETIFVLRGGAFVEAAAAPARMLS